ncbi:hypothetical protein [Portibacter marinus]|uniref:hypothetical protein n=1 Tax=Portibacter marinus TaxID=2898660 RepID=UPI001F39B94E|nr:hypothetical protein [Portibacter marinus]
MLRFKKGESPSLSIFPSTLPIKRFENYHTHHIGTYSQTNQFMIYETFLFLKPFNEIKKNEEWQNFRKEYVVIYKFDKYGELISYEYLDAGTVKTFDEELTEKWISNQLDTLENYVYKDIKIKPFEVIIDGFSFGLIPNSESEMIEMQPSNTIAFGEPWNGEYDT